MTPLADEPKVVIVINQLDGTAYASTNISPNVKVTLMDVSAHPNIDEAVLHGDKLLLGQPYQIKVNNPE